jgi:hypothetical protein
VPAPSPFSDKENFILQTASLFLAGRISDHLGAFVKGTYDGVRRHTSWDNMDVRYARTLELGGHAVVAGLDINNNPTVQDLWNSTPIWGFPYVAPELGANPTAAQLIRGFLAQSVLGTSVYSMIDNRLYLELGAYRGLSEKWLANLGAAGASAHLSGAAPYMRATLQKQQGGTLFRGRGHRTECQAAPLPHHHGHRPLHGLRPGRELPVHRSRTAGDRCAPGMDPRGSAPGCELCNS